MAIVAFILLCVGITHNERNIVITSMLIAGCTAFIISVR